MHVHLSVWIVTLALWAVFLAVDMFVIGRRPHEPSNAESVRHLSFFIGAAGLFAVGVWIVSGPTFGGQFVAGWLTEYSLSVDNLFVFLILMSKLRVPRALQSSALFIGIVLAVVLRGIFIAVGAAAINRFSWVFYLFGLFLIYTAIKLARESGQPAEAEYAEPRVVGWLRRRIPSTPDYRGAH